MSGTAATERRRLGRIGPEVSAIGLGCMSLSGVYGTSDDTAAIPLALLGTAITVNDVVGGFTP